MDPTHRAPDEYGQGHDRSGGEPGLRRPSRESGGADLGPGTPQQVRVVQLTVGDLLLTVNPVDGSEVESCPPGSGPDAPVRRTPAERADHERAGAPPVPAGPPAPQLPLLERQEERERLVRLLARGRSVRLTGQAGSGRTALLDAVAADCADLAPDGVVRLNGRGRTGADLLYALFDTVFKAPGHRPDRDELLALVRSIGAVVTVDDLEIGGAALDELLAATPECAFLLAATLDVTNPGVDAHLEEVLLAGLGRGASLSLLEKVVERPLTEEERNWAGDLWFESEGLPLRFVQAGSLLVQRDRLRAGPEAFDEYDYFEPRADDAPPAPAASAEALDVPLPSLGEGAAPAALLASRLSEAARATLRFAVALGGEVPHQAHLPALVGDTHADAALGELAGCGLLSPAGPRYRLAAGVLAQLTAAEYEDDAAAHARTAAQHYAWWASHPSVTPERAVAEADAIVASLGRLVPGDEAGAASAAVLLARSASPAFAAGLGWGAWERALRIGQEAARIAGEVAEEAYFHHELGVLALCTGNPDRARTELETSIGMRGALADRSGAVAGRRALALVADRSGDFAPLGRTASGDEVPMVRQNAPGTPPGGFPGAPAFLRQPAEEQPTVVSSLPPGPAARRRTGRAVLGGARRNLAAAGAGAALIAVLGTVVTLGVTAGDGDEPGSRNVTTEQTSTEAPTDDGPPAEEPQDGSAPAGETTGGETSATPSASDSASPSTSGSPSPSASTSSGTPPGTDDPTDDGSSSPSEPTPTRTSPRPTETDSESPSPTPSESESETPTETPTEEPPAPPPAQGSSSASGPVESASAPESEAAVDPAV
ncbi:tetratricopeptide repeat protein [Streptomyces sp. NPDC094466]|uniref:tetratricopeptide repeat protein n=1 Tax=Streptomyces sp. NPDC094466 TaxID=3366065 RepID=UPI0038154EBD